MDFRSTRVQIRTFTIVLALFAAFYVVAYLSAPALPGGFEHPLGWWGWSDQGLYLKSAQAFSRLDFRSSEHTYPILYSLSAAPFVRVMPIHPFFIVDLACFLITVGGFLKIGSKIIGLWPSAILFVCVICLRWILVADWIIPWTSTLSAAITTILLLACANERFAQGGSPVRNYLAFAVLLSLLALTRPLDLIIDLVMYGYIAVRCIGAARMNKQAIFSARHFAIAGAFVAGIVIGPALMAAFNLRVYGQVTSPYMQVMRDTGFDLITIPKKFVSLFNDAASVFLAPKQTFLRGYPWLALTMAMIPSVLAFGPNILRLITVIACLHVALYLAFGDLLPNNLYTFHTIHYFKLWIPYFALIAAAGLLLLYRARASTAARYVAAGGVALAALLCSLGFRFSTEPIRTTLVAPHTITVEPASGSEVTLDFIDFPGVSSDTQLKYLIGANQVVADDRRLRRLGDVHLLKGEFGLRAMFTRQLTFYRLVITLDDSFRIPDEISASGVQYTIGLRWPLQSQTETPKLYWK
jgi:hypothetical protein